MKTKYSVMATGFAMFSMFFGSGNLVFPLNIGKLCQGHWALASLGLLLTGVAVPFVGLLAMMLYDGSANLFFGRLGKGVSFWISLLSLSLMGPFGVLARCITVACGSLSHLFSISLPAFSVLFCAVIFLMTANKSRLLSFLGAVLTPLLLGSLCLIVASGLYFGSRELAPSLFGKRAALTHGLLEGYQTMDLLAAFFFSSFVIQHLGTLSQKEGRDERIKIFVRSSILGAGLLALVYVGLVWLGALYAPYLEGIAPEKMLAAVAYKALGSGAAPIVCASVVLACLTTAVVLASLYAEFLQKEVCCHKLGPIPCMLATLVIAFCISTLEFSGIAAFIGPILTLAYPALIVLALCNIGYRFFGWKPVKGPVLATLALTYFYS